MLAEQSLREGDLDKALTQLQDQIKKDPSNAKFRIFLFQLLSVMGQWERALTQLNVLGDLDAGSLAMVQTYREALQCEVLRAEVFAGKRSPLIFGEPQAWVALQMQALSLSAQGEVAQSQQVREQAFEQAPATSGQLDGEAFTWIADADARLGPLLEVIINGRYYWVPFQRIQKIQLDAPEDLRDSVWMPGEFTWANGGQTVGLIPTRYANTEQQADGLLRLARKTDWQDCGAELFAGVGQRLLATDTNEYPLMDVREITLDTAEAAAEQGTD